EAGRLVSFNLSVVPSGHAVLSPGDPLGAGSLTRPPLRLQDGPPAMGTLSLDRRASTTMPVPLPASRRLRFEMGDCRGYFDETPTVILQTSTSQNIRVRLTSPLDTVL